ncbi:MAG: hypothetical protein ACFFFT_06235 [Candidatus Thorarchaeota archaeon]
MNFNYNLESFKNKRDLIEELNYYKFIILKKVKIEDYNSALEKIRSALILIEEHKSLFNLEKELSNFYELNKQVNEELLQHRRIYERRFNNLLREKLNESNLENFSKLLAMLKSEVDHNLDKCNLEDISDNITKYFKFIKKLYEILSCYKVLNYHDASEKIFDFVRDIKSENFPNLKLLISLIYQNLLNFKLLEFSKKYDKVSVSTLSNRMSINQDRLVNFINLIMKQPKSPIKSYISDTQEVYFKKVPF